MSTTNFRAAKDVYHDSLVQYQGAVERIEEAALEQQRQGRDAVTAVNDAVLQAGVKATCVIRATTDALIVDLDAESGAQVPDEAVLNNAVTTLDARLALLSVARRDLNAMVERLNKQLDAAAAAGQAAKDKLACRCEAK